MSDADVGLQNSPIKSVTSCDMPVVVTVDSETLGAFGIKMLFRSHLLLIYFITMHAISMIYLHDVV